MTQHRLDEDSLKQMIQNGKPVPVLRNRHGTRAGGDTRRGDPQELHRLPRGESGSAQLSPACLLLILPSAIPGHSSTQVFSQCCSGHRIQRSVEQGPAPGKDQSPAAQLSCSQCDPRSPNTAHLLRGAETETVRGAGHGMPQHTSHGQALLGPSRLLSPGLGAQLTHPGKLLVEVGAHICPSSKP